jgi:glycosyltransferase involved in cell wall biosynthesis
MLTVGFDATPLLGRRTGIGIYCQEVLAGLARLPELEVTATAFSLRGLGALPSQVPEGVRTRTRPFPANLLQRRWMRSDRPTLGLLGMGRVKVFHGSNYVLPPLVRGQAGVLTIQDLGYHRNPGLVDEASLRFRVLVPRGLTRAALVICPTQVVAEQVVEDHGFPLDRIVVTPLGVDPAWFQEQAAVTGFPSSYLLAVGTLEPRKGLDVLLSALRVLHDRGADVPPLVLVGPPGWGPTLDASGLPDGAVITPGYLEISELRSVVAGAAALIFPSRDEGFGLPPLEAMAVGTPVLASDLPVTREVLGNAALLTPVEDVEALAEGILRVLQVPRGTAIEHARGYTWTLTAALTRDAYLRAAS